MSEFQQGLIVSALAEILATNARIEGMKAENAIRAHDGNAPAYGEAHFEHMASTLEGLANYTRSIIP